MRLGCGPEEPPTKRAASGATATTTLPAPGNSVRGRVLTPDGLPVARRRVTLGTASVLTDAEGGFEFQAVPSSYDVRVDDWYGYAPASVYLGLTSRNPVLVIREGTTPEVAWRYHAAIVDAVDTRSTAEEGPWTKRLIQFLSPHGWTQPRESGHGKSYYRDLEFSWRGSDTETGTLVSLVGYGPSEAPWASAYLASAPLSLLDGDAVAVSPTLHKIGTGSLAGKARTRGPIWPSSTGESLRFSYKLPGLMGSIDLGECATADGCYACQLPDLSELPGEYCIHVGEDARDERVSRCGGRLGMDDFSVPPHPPAPVLKYGDDVDESTMVAWTGEGKVFELRLGPSHSANIRVYTAKQSFSWDDFVALGFGWSGFQHVGSGGFHGESQPAMEVFTVSALYPYQSMDDLVAGRGVMATGTSWQKAPSARDRLPSKRRLVSIPQSVVSRLKEFKSPTADSVPQDLFHLPTCPSTKDATPVADIRPAMVETRVALRGTLTFAGGWACTMKGCSCCNSCDTEWVVVDPNVPGSGLATGLGIGAKSCKIPPTPKIDVVVTGKLMRSLGAIGPTRSQPFFIEDASLCAVKGDDH
jgi:hypothetical protein